MARPAMAEYPPGARLATRMIDDYELVWMLQGHARYVADEELDLLPGHLLMIPPGVRHGFHWDRDRPSRHGYVHFELPRRGRAPRQAQLHRMTSQDPLGALCAYLLWLGQAEQADWETLADRTARFMVELMTSGGLPGAPAPPSLPPTLSAVIDHLRNVWGVMPLRRVTVGELADVAHVSRGYLNRLFRAAFGTSAAGALERLRCSRAEGLLLRTDLTLTVIARECGYADLYHFSHRFRHLHGIAPGHYRSADPAGTSVLDLDGMRRLAHLVWG